jgi:hypothetical protein
MADDQTEHSHHTFDTAYNTFLRLEHNYINDCRKRKQENQSFRCVNCKKEGGTLFQTIFQPEQNDEEAYKIMTAKCGANTKCGLDIELWLPRTIQITELLEKLNKDIQEDKQNLIIAKNRVMFGIITEKDVVDVYASLKNSIEATTNVYEQLLGEYYSKIDNKAKKQQIVDTLQSTYPIITKIKHAMDVFKETKDVMYVKRAVDYYLTELRPSLDNLQSLQYPNVKVIQETNDEYYIEKNEHTIQDYEYTFGEPRVVKYKISL